MYAIIISFPYTHNPTTQAIPNLTDPSGRLLHTEYAALMDGYCAITRKRTAAGLKVGEYPWPQEGIERAKKLVHRVDIKDPRFSARLHFEWHNRDLQVHYVLEPNHFIYRLHAHHVRPTARR
jgi:hypothetical protein